MEEGDWVGHMRHYLVSKSRPHNRLLNISGRQRKIIHVESNASNELPYMQSTHRSICLFIYLWTAVGYSINTIRWSMSSTPCFKLNSSVICTNCLSVKVRWFKYSQSSLVMLWFDHFCTIMVKSWWNLSSIRDVSSMFMEDWPAAEVVSLIALPVVELTDGEMERL